MPPTKANNNVAKPESVHEIVSKLGYGAAVVTSNIIGQTLIGSRRSKGGVDSLSTPVILNIFYLEQIREALAGNQSQADRFVEVAKQEASALRTLSHANLVKLRDFIVEANGSVFIFELEYCGEGVGTLQNFIEARLQVTPSPDYMPENLIKKWLRQIIEAVIYLNANGLGHRDITAKNIFLVDSGRSVKLGYSCILLSLVKQIPKEKNEAIIGLLTHLPPEVIHGEDRSKKSDSWAIGILLYHMTMLNLPYCGSDFDILLGISSGSRQSVPSANKYTVQLSNLVSLLLQNNPKKRPDPKDILRDPFFTAEEQ